MKKFAIARRLGLAVLCGTCLLALIACEKSASNSEAEKAQPKPTYADMLPGPGSGSSSPQTPAQTKRSLEKLAGSVSCDCSHVDAGLLTGPYRDQCNAAEAKLKEKVGAGTFTVTVKDDIILGGDICDGVAQGPNAWPRKEGPVTPPKKASGGPACRYVGGARQYDCPN